MKRSFAPITRPEASCNGYPTFYSKPKEGKAELDRILKMDPKPIGAQHFGGTTDTMAAKGKLDERAGHVEDGSATQGCWWASVRTSTRYIDYAESKGWDVDFYQCCFYRVESAA